MDFPALVTVLALLLYAATGFRVGQMRARHNVMAPSVSGPPEFERAFRVQQNTLEQIVLFIPALWLFAFLVSPNWAGAIGLVWIGGRICYGSSYLRDPQKRGPGFLVAFGAAAVLLVGALVGAIVKLF